MKLYHKSPYLEIDVEYYETDEHLDSVKFYIKETEHIDHILQSHDWAYYQCEISSNETMTFEGIVSKQYFDKKTDLHILILRLYNLTFIRESTDWVLYNKRNGNIDNMLD